MGGSIKPASTHDEALLERNMDQHASIQATGRHLQSLHPPLGRRFKILSFATLPHRVAIVRGVGVSPRAGRQQRPLEWRNSDGAIKHLCVLVRAAISGATSTSVIAGGAQLSSKITLAFKNVSSDTRGGGLTPPVPSALITATYRT